MHISRMILNCSRMGLIESYGLLCLPWIRWTMGRIPWVFFFFFLRRMKDDLPSDEALMLRPW